MIKTAEKIEFNPVFEINPNNWIQIYEFKQFKSFDLSGISSESQSEDSSSEEQMENPPSYASIISNPRLEEDLTRISDDIGTGIYLFSELISCTKVSIPVKRQYPRVIRPK